MRLAPLTGVVCSGNIVLDILVRPVDRHAWGTTIWVKEIEQHLGGNGANSSYCLGRLGVPVRLMGWIGTDAFGDFALNKLQSSGVDCRWIKRTGAPTATTVGLVNSQGDRMFLHRPGASSEAFPAPVEFSATLVEGYSHYHVANPFGLPNLRIHAAECLRRARAAGLSTSMDTGWDSQGRWMQDAGSCLEHTDLLFVNESEARLLTGVEDPLEGAHILHRLGVGVVVVKLGGYGCVVVEGETETRASACRVDAIDTTGAGDCFVGGFLAALHHEYSLEAAARFANAVAALSTLRLGAADGLLSFSDTRAWLERAEMSG